MTSKLLLAAIVLYVEGCAVYTTELASIATLGPESPRVHDCEKQPNRFSTPPSGAALCLSFHGVEMEIEAHNAVTVAAAFGPLPLVPYFPEREPVTTPLTIDIGFETERRHAFFPWRVTLQTDQGEAISVRRVSKNVRDGSGVHAVPIDARDVEAGVLDEGKWHRFCLTFDKHVPPEQSFTLTIHLVAPDGGDVQLPIAFKKGKVSSLAAIP